MDTTTVLSIIISGVISLAVVLIHANFSKNAQIVALVARVDALEKSALANPALINQAASVVHALPPEIVSALADGNRLATQVLLAATPPANVPPSITPQA